MVLINIPYTLFSLGASALFVHAQTTPAPTATPSVGNAARPLTEYTFTYPNLPEQVNPFASARGPQSGYNICNSTTEGATSMCQTMFVNSIEDFCLWGGPKENSVIGNVEAIVVAYCTKPGHGTRLIPPGALTGVQFIKTTGYLQVTGVIDQTKIGLKSDDAGGELDPHGADLAGNPLGGLVFSNNLPPAKDNSTIVQVNNWNNFLGGNQFCIKVCSNAIKSPDYCQNKFDTQGCFFNMPASYKDNEFTSCLGENQAEPGGNPVIPASSSCTTYTSSLLYPNPSTSTTASSAASGASGSRTSAAASATKSSGKATAIGHPSSGTGFFALACSFVVAAFAGVVML